MEEDSFLGTGMKFPPQADETTGRFQTVSGTENVKESVTLILMTQRSERFMRPDFGSDIQSYAFTDTGGAMLNLMASRLSSQLLSQEPRIQDVSVFMDTESREGCLFIHVDYIVRRTGTKENLVFPFYLQ